MNGSRNTTAKLIGAALAMCVALASGTAQAVTMNNFGGVYSGATASPDTILKFVNGGVITPGVGGSVLTGATSDDLSVDLTGYTGVINGAGDNVTLPSFSVTLGGNKALFDVLSAKLTQSSLAFGSFFFGLGVVEADVKLNAGLTTVPGANTELAPFLAGGKLILTYNGILVSTDGTNGHAQLSFAPTASYTIFAVPEPATVTMLILGSGAVALIGLRARRSSR